MQTSFSEKSSVVPSELRVAPKARKPAIPPSDLRVVPKVPSFNETVLLLSYRLAPGYSNEEEIARSTEPLASVACVQAVDYSNEETIWVVGMKDADKLSSHLRIFGRQVHFRPENGTVYRPPRYYLQPNGFIFPHYYRADSLPPLDARHPIIEDIHIQRIRKDLPYACGISVLQYGEVELLLKRIPRYIAYMSEFPRTIGGLPYFVRWVPDQPLIPTCSHAISSESKIDEASGKQFIEDAGCFGLKLRNQEGKYAITAATHAFVKLPEELSLSSFFLVRVATQLFVDAPNFIHRKLRHYMPRLLGLDPPLGIEVYIPSGDTAEIRSPVGTITKSFDTPSSTVPYPEGYRHDLSVITGPNLPDIVAAPGLPLLKEFLPFNDVFEHRDRAIFTVSYPFLSDPAVSGLETTDLVAHESLLSALRIEWSDSPKDNITSAVIWRTKAAHLPTKDIDMPEDAAITEPPQTMPLPDGGNVQAIGPSGSVLCVGSDEASSSTPVPSSAKVICFHNFQMERPTLRGPTSTQNQRNGDTKGDLASGANKETYPTFQGGFQLPSEIYNYTIDMGRTQASESNSGEAIDIIIDTCSFKPL
ncbi:hypothetical protein VNI00_001902 [Paramarasmius palmivorus]|uniref:Uncharacterized protein n=1 Tax=Paramarasmius palmivorus TaxID=297713 RepID=A0AAW0E002_9AGAR